MTKGIFKKKSPGRRLLIHKIKKKPPKSHCAICGTILSTKLQKSTKSGKYSDRPYKSQLCHACLRTSIQLVKI